MKSFKIIDHGNKLIYEYTKTQFNLIIVIVFIIGMLTGVTLMYTTTEKKSQTHEIR